MAKADGPVQADSGTRDVKCPVCGSSCADEPPLERYSVQDAAAHFCPPWRDQARNERLVASIRKLWGRDFTTIHRCGACGFGFGWPFVGGDAAFYSIIHEEFGYPSWRWEYGVARDISGHRFPKGGKALDIGSGDGSFLLGLPEGWARHATESTETTRALLRGRGISVFENLDHAAATAAGTFQLVTLFQVIEHVAEFGPMLASIANLLAPDGIVVLSTPYFDELVRQQRATCCPDMPPNHINKWNERSLTIALGRAGLRADRFEIEPPSWRQLPSSLYLRVRADGQYRSRSLAGMAYRIHNRSVRANMLRAVGVLTLPKLIPHLSDAKLRANFLVVARLAGSGTSRGDTTC